MSLRLSALIVTACLCAVSHAESQAPNLSRPQRELLQAMITAVDAAATDLETSGVQWQHHVLRASDGSHYVAFTLTPPPASRLPAGPSALYVRLSTQNRVERSPVAEWLAGNLTAPPPIAASSGIAVGDMPLMGATGNLARRPSQTPEMAQLAILDLERRREAERDAQRERQRRAQLEGRSTRTSETLPFEDFDLASRSQGGAIQRALTAGPGEYFLYVAWADPAAARPADTVRVLKQRLSLPAAAITDLSIGSVILADGMQVRTRPYTPIEQTSHPYAIGLTEILPSADSAFTDAENLAVVFQVINARPAEDGKPNLDVNFQIVRVLNNDEQPVAALTPQNHSAETLPANFDLRVGHPLFATVSAPMATLKRGQYRLKILVSDRIAGHTATADADFRVTATAAGLLGDAPSLGLPFRSESILGKEALPAILASLRPASPSPALQRAFELASTGRYVDLMVEEPVPAAEEGVRAALRGVALLGVGDSSAAVQFQRAQLLAAPLGPARLLSGAARAMQLRDADAIAAWQEAITAGAPKALVVPHLLDAYLRRGDYQRATPLVAEMRGTREAWSRGAAAVLIATQKEAEAITLLDARIAASPDDLDAQWLLLHALFSQIARNTNSPVSTRDRFAASARAYINSKGVNASLAEEWLASLR